MSPTPTEIQNAKIEVFKELYTLWGKRKWPLEIIRFETLNKLLSQNKEFNYSETKYNVWKEVV